MFGFLDIGPKYEDDDVELQELTPKPSSTADKSKTGTNNVQRNKISLFTVICAHLQILLRSFKFRAIAIASVVIIGIVYWGSLFSGGDANKQMTDFSNVNSQLDLQLGSIHHWCLHGGDSSCNCDDPLTPRSGIGKEWHGAHDLNVNDIDEFLKNAPSADIVFLGDDITEEWRGTAMGVRQDDMGKVARVFNKLFTREGGGPIDGLALGLAGDTGTNLLWRIRNGEMPEDLNPKIWWLLVGINDLKINLCSPEVVIMSIIRIVEEIQVRKPGSKIVLNGILPAADSDGKLGELIRAAHMVNAQLKAFAEKHYHVEFFDEGNMFIDRDSANKQRLSLIPEMITDGFHLSALGHQMWGERIQKKALFLMVNM